VRQLRTGLEWLVASVGTDGAVAGVNGDFVLAFCKPWSEIEQAVLTAIGQVSGVVGCTLTLNGSSSANVTPGTAVTLLTLGTLTVS